MLTVSLLEAEMGRQGNVNYHESLFIRISPAWVPPSIFRNLTCCVVITETINEAHISILIICVHCTVRSGIAP
jgi:hypothetical protein